MEIVLNDFTGGLNLEQSPYAIADNEFTICDNFIVENFGLQRRKGFVVVDSFPEASKIVSAYFVKSKPFTWVVIFSNGAVYLYDESTRTKNLIGTINLLSTPKIAEFGEYICIAHGASLKLIHLSNKTLHDTNSPLAVDVLTQHGRVVIAGNDFLWWSGVGDPFQWDANNSSNPAMYVQVGFKDGGKIIGITNLYNDIIVFKTTGLYRVQDWEVTLVTRQRSAWNNQSYISFFGEVLVIDRLGLYQISTAQQYGDLVIDVLDRKVKNFLLQNYEERMFYLPVLKAIAFGLKNKQWLLFFYQTKTFVTWSLDPSIVILADNGQKVKAFGNFVYDYDGDMDDYSPLIASLTNLPIYYARDLIKGTKPIFVTMRTKKWTNTKPVILKRLGVVLEKKSLC